MRNKRLNDTVSKVKVYAEKMARMSDAQLQAETPKLKSLLKSGKTLEQILPEAYAAICEADKRILGKYPYDNQIFGAIAMHHGHLVEMNTGEGKTLTATMPLYLNALTEKSTILVTANEYLAYRDAAEMRPVFAFMGMNERAGVSRQPDGFLTNDQKRENYNADILYTTHGVLAFDYLLNNLVMRAEDRFLRKFYFIIIDEADSVLLDGAQMPLVISGSPRVQSNLYAMTDFFVSTLKADRDYETEDKAVWLTDQGVAYAERFFGIQDFYAHENFELNRHVTLALRAHVLLKRQEDYMVSDQGEIVLLDNGTGRSLPGMKLRGGEHQALEQKEHLELTQEQRSIASITYQNLFIMFPKMCGMSGTISNARRELRSVYHKKVVVVPPHKKLQRIDRKDRYFVSAEEQYEAALEETLHCHQKGQPVLIVTATIQDTQIFSRMLVDKGVPHSVLNADNAYWEAEIIAAAGMRNAVTVSTGMAGRGTDIKLEKGVAQLGGLAVIGIGRMENVRLERQARGRAGRQGDPGSSQFFVSLEDDIVMTMYAEKAEEYIDGNRSISHRKLKHIINNAQKTMEEQGISSREQAVRYDEILRRQREILYNARDRLLDQAQIDKGTMQDIVNDTLQSFVKTHPKLQSHDLNRYVLDNLSYELDPDILAMEKDSKQLLERMEKYAAKLYDRKVNSFENAEQLQEYIRQCILNALDDGWVEEVDYLQQLQYAITTRGTAQRNPIFEYSREAYHSFEDMKTTMKRNITRNFFLGDPEMNEDGQMKIVFP
ncbi:MAG: accessory Sec system translocase SecA2 [Absicoccus sp.]|uniref:accessory Sec system translocase SecA2 n=1 Tax=Absicoccus sp. TaxID=2718527 RepID=UPI002A75540D|nr:accessory Sec system translocase SecA2 [Absicoccus sp.]MDY3036595.1 accessory Sec system translocase SecA2 [Absicoccus sp.]